MNKQLRESISDLPRTSVKECSGVYILWDKDTVVYVGRSTNIPKRIGQHIAKFRKFDSFSYKTIPFHQIHTLSNLERTLIKEYQPKYNIESKDFSNKKYRQRDANGKYMAQDGWKPVRKGWG